ncbi:MAG: hypothetical protein P1P89_21800 [Desulfobacterales bacterium]|nr:hypothetical protein [Desulfobacterales bacterium]
MTNRKNSAFQNRYEYFFIRLALTLTILTLLTGCFANYGKYSRSRDVAKMFETLQVPGDYKYYYTGSDKDPDALMGLQRDYALNNDLWKETEMDRKQLKKWIDEINLIGYSSSANGHLILDPNGKTIGIYYSKWDGGPIKMESGNQVLIHLPDTNGHKRPMLLMKNDLFF